MELQAIKHKWNRVIAVFFSKFIGELESSGVSCIISSALMIQSEILSRHFVKLQSICYTECLQ